MSTTITIKLNKDAHQFQAGESAGFGIRGGVQFYNRDTKAKEWTNYEAAVFVRNPAQVQFYQDNLREGSIVQITGQTERIKQFDGNNGPMFSIELIDASIGYINSPQYAQQASQQQQAPQRQAPQQQQQQPQQRQPAQQQAPQQPAQQQYTQGHPEPKRQPQNLNQYNQAPPQQFEDDTDIPFSGVSRL